LRKEQGFTLIEITVTVAIMGILLAILYNVVVQGAFQQKRIKDEMAVQNTAKALLNHIGEVVLEQNPVNSKIVSTINGSTPSINSSYTVSTSLVFNKGERLTKITDGYSFAGKTYNNISSVSVNVKKNGLLITVQGSKDNAKLQFTSTFYTRNS